MCRGIQVGPKIKQIISLYATSELITSQELRHQKKKPQYLNGYVTLTKLTARMPSYGKMKVIRNLTQFYLELLEALNLSLLPLFESPCIENFRLLLQLQDLWCLPLRQCSFTGFRFGRVRTGQTICQATSGYPQPPDVRPKTQLEKSERINRSDLSLSNMF